ncbi:MAG TPA: hypothetical protein PKM34_01310 [Bacteroidales bacterium]|nr:hypothetical protein [Bacteroidales bacterium]
MKLKLSVNKRIRTNKRLKFALLDYFNISGSTLQRWLDSNDPSFTEYKSLQLIAAYLHVDDVEELLESADVSSVGI